MEEIVKIRLDNEMDLILAHKRAMKLAELCGLSVSSQTTFATAVSEIARCAISVGKDSLLVLSIHFLRANKKEISASVFDKVNLSEVNSEAISYARKLMGEIEAACENGTYRLSLRQHIPFSGTLTATKIESFKDYFKFEPPLSPYDEIRKKNILLIELANKLRESENQYRLLTDTLPLMMFAINQRGEGTYYNKWLKDFFNTGESVISSIPWLSWVHPEDQKNLFSEWEKAQSQRTAMRLQARLKTKNREEYLWHLVNIVPLKNESTPNAGWIGFFVDIHAQKQIEETLKDNKELKLVQEELRNNQLILEQKIQELNLSNQDLEQFAYIASHDLQEPLRKIITFSNLIEKNAELEGKNREYFQKIISSSSQMTSLIKSVLNYSRLNNPNEITEEVDLNEIMDTVLADFDILINDHGATVNIESNLPVISGIKLQIIQLFSNLLSNALKFSRQQPVISISSESETHPDGSSIKTYHKISFRDNGIGFEPQYKTQIFDIFQRLNSRQAYMGTGIGLALCKKVMENHGGMISAESQPGEGSVFYLFFPAY